MKERDGGKDKPGPHAIFDFRDYLKEAERKGEKYNSA